MENRKVFSSQMFPKVQMSSLWADWMFHRVLPRIKVYNTDLIQFFRLLNFPLEEE